jgi:DNA-binding PadR family transcriptional regulator
MVASEWSTQAGRRRRTYRLTRAGEKALGERRREWRLFATAIEAVLT